MCAQHLADAHFFCAPIDRKRGKSHKPEAGQKNAESRRAIDHGSQALVRPVLISEILVEERIAQRGVRCDFPPFL